MCGIFGVITKEKSNFDNKLYKKTVDLLFKLSESRGKESAGLAFLDGNTIKVYKQPLPASSLIRQTAYKELFESKNFQAKALIGHARLVTNGGAESNLNNQPVRSEGIVGVHNGIICNDAELWQKFTALNRCCEVDTEVIFSLIRMYVNDGLSLIKSVKNTFSLLEGAASIAVFLKDFDYLLLATNTGSLYTAIDKNKKVLIFASEKYIIDTLLKNGKLNNLLGDFEVSQIKAGSGQLINIYNLVAKEFSMVGNDDNEAFEIKKKAGENFNIVDIFDDSIDQTPNSQEQIINIVADMPFADNYFSRLIDPIKALKRCTKCILPETMPFIEFDDKGECNYCRNYHKVEVKGQAALEAVIAKYRSDTDKPDCLLPFSGGRDSSYGLYYVKKVLKMNPIAYSYDWGMLTDIGRRNQARMCGKLGIEHILVSADIKKKRENIKKNVTAWLKKPELGSVPLFMAGDKQYFYYANKINKQISADLIFYFENQLEKTYFKSGFCGIAPQYIQKNAHTLAFFNKVKLAAYYSKQFLSNLAYFNSSLLDTFTGFLSQYFISHDYLLFFDYIKWDEKEVVSTLVNEYDWEIGKDAAFTWRNGDATMPFYNYIYYTMAGFTENDTFRSNQIREGVITRAEALKLVVEENRPRYDLVKIYCDMLGLNFKDVLEKINSIPRIYKI